MFGSVSRLGAAAMVALLLLGATAGGQTVHVPDDFSTIQDAIDSDGVTEVIVAAGTYVENIVFDKPITVRSADGAAVTIDGDDSGPTVTIGSGATLATVLEGFTITGGRSSFGGGIAFPVFSQSGATIRGCTITGNSATTFGGGIYFEPLGGPGLLLENCIVACNDTDPGGGGGGVYINGPATVVNCLIEGNTSSQGGGLYVFAGNPTATNCTVVGNIANAANGAAVRGVANINLRNCILWDNTDGAANTQIVGFATVQHSNVQGGFTGTGNIDVDPAFGSDFHLTALSDCVDAGSNGFVPAGVDFDLDGDPNARIQDGDCDGTATVDMGAYELPAGAGGELPDAMLATDQLLGIGAEAIALLDASGSMGAPGEALTYAWYIGESLLLGETSATVDLSLDYGSYEVRVEVTGDCGTASDERTLVLDPDCLAVFDPQKAEVRFDEGKVKVSGEIGLPLGVDYLELMPMALTSLDVGGIPVLTDSGTVFLQEGGNLQKWRFEDDDATTGIRRFDLDWKGARYRFNDFGVKIESELISADQTTLELKYKMNEIGGAFSVTFAGVAGSVTVDVDTNGLATTTDLDTTIEVEKAGKEVLVTLPLPLSEDSTITFAGAIVAPTVDVADDLKTSVGRFKLEVLFDPDPPSVSDTPALDLHIEIGAIGYPGTIAIPEPQFDVKDDRWKAKK